MVKVLVSGGLTEELTIVRGLGSVKLAVHKLCICIFSHVQAIWSLKTAHIPICGHFLPCSRAHYMQICASIHSFIFIQWHSRLGLWCSAVSCECTPMQMIINRGKEVKALGFRPSVVPNTCCLARHYRKRCGF